MIKTAPSLPRIAILDTLRGLVVVLMVIFHGIYDAVYIFGYSLTWFSNTAVQSIWAAAVSWIFLLLAGWMARLSRNNYRRAVRYGVVAAAIAAVTASARLPTPITYGILYCIAASTLLYALTESVLVHVPPMLGVVLSCSLFFAAYRIPESVWPIEHLAWLGLPSAGFSSADYYPLLPYAFIYLAGAYLGMLVEQHCSTSYPMWMMRDRWPALTMIGRMSLAIYIVHQPVLLLLLALIR